jgi:acyl-CoA hydrolase
VQAMVAIADPKHREALEIEARRRNLWRAS